MKNNKFKMLLLLLAIAMFTVACNVNNEEMAKEKEEKIGNFQTVDLDGKEITQEIFKENDLTMVNVFSTTCNPCMKELPYLAELSTELKNEKIRIVGLNIDMDLEGNPDENAIKIVKDVLSKVNSNMTVIFPDNNLIENVLTKTDAMPYTFFVDKNGNIVGESYLGDRSKEEWKKIIKEELQR